MKPQPPSAGPEVVAAIQRWCLGRVDTAEVQGWGETEAEAARWAIQVHGVGAFLVPKLAGTALWAALPLQLRDYLERQYRLNAQRIGVLLEELARILEAAARAGIEVIPLKGSVLACHHYEDPAVRPMADLDLLVRPAEAGALIAELGALGFSPSGKTGRHDTFILSRRGEAVVDYGGEHPGNPYCLDLHTVVDDRLWGLKYPLTERLWAAAKPGAFAGAPGLLLQPAVLLEHLLIHASHDMRAGKFRWIQLRDIGQLIPQVGASEWAAMLASASEKHGERFLWAPLFLAGRHAAAAAPSEVVSRLQSQTPAGLVAFLERAEPWYLSYCNPKAQTLSEKLCWHRPGLERLGGLRSMLLPTPRELSQWYPHTPQGVRTPFLYVRYAWRAAGWFLRQARDRRRRAWPYL